MFSVYVQRVFCKSRLPESVEVEELNIVMGPTLCVRMHVTETSNPGPSASPKSQMQLIPVEDVWMMLFAAAKNTLSQGGASSFPAAWQNRY